MLPDFIARCFTRFTDRRPTKDGEGKCPCHDRFSFNDLQDSYLRIVEVTHQLYNLEQGDMPTTAYLHKARALADQMAAAGTPMTVSEFNIFVLKGLRPEFKDMVTCLAAQWVPLSFSELHSLLLSHEFFNGDEVSPGFSKAPGIQNCRNNAMECKKDKYVSNQRGISSNTLHACCSDHFDSGAVPPDFSKAPENQKSGSNAMVISKSMESKNNKYVSTQRDISSNTFHAYKGTKSIPLNNSWITRDDFPDDFVFGTATSSYQFEGGAAEGGRGLGVWDIFTLETPDRIFDGSNGNVAVDMYNRYREDIAMMKKMGLDACRISISWPRILPGGRSTAGVNREGINFYNDLIDKFLANGIEPYVTLFHWDLPYCLEKEYDGFLSEKIIDDFRDFAELCFWEFGDRVKSWITLNEPWSYSTSGYVTGKFPPSKPLASAEKISNNFTTYRAIHDPKISIPIPSNNAATMTSSNLAKDAYTVAKNLLLVHAAAVHSYRTKFQEHQEGKIGIVLCCQWYEPYDAASPDDVTASIRAMDFMMGWFLEPVLYGKYPKSMTDFVPSTNLALFSDDESDLLRGSIDFLGLNYYTANYVANDNKPNAEQGYYKDQKVAFHAERDGKQIGPQGGSDWLYIVPWGVHKLLSHIKNTYASIPPIYITENGLDEKNDCKLTAYEACRDTKRVQYHQDHLAFILKAMQEGVDVRGYFIWSWCDNFEWYEGYTVRFGLVYIDYINNLTRYPKSSAIWFAKFLKKNNKLLLKDINKH